MYFKVGNLIRFLLKLEAGGINPADIVKRYVYFTAACGGPCQSGMYENEFRMALRAAGYHGFRVVSFSNDHGFKASTGHSGLHFSVDFGMNALHAIIVGDLLNAVHRRLKPYEMQAGASIQAVARAANVTVLTETLRRYQSISISICACSR